MLSASATMRPSMVNSLVDSFFEAKKGEIKCRLRDQLDHMVDDVFVELVTTVKDLLLPPEEGQPPQNTAANVIPTKEPAIPKSSVIVPRKFFAVKSMPGTSSAAGPSGVKRRRSTRSTASKESKQKESSADQQQLVVFNKRARTKSMASCTSLKTNQSKSSKKTSNGKYSCSSQECGKSFKRPSELKRHERIHSGVKPFQCKWPNCTFASSSRASAINHIQIIHLKPNSTESEEISQAPPLDKDPLAYLEELTDLL